MKSHWILSQEIEPHISLTTHNQAPLPLEHNTNTFKQQNPFLNA